MALIRRDLPLARDASGRFLPWLIAFMVYLAVLALAAALVLGKTVQRWDSGLSGRLTVQIPAAEGEGRDSIMQARIDQVLDILTSTPGVRSAEVLEQEDIDRLLSPWLGEGLLTGDLPLPRLIAVTADAALDLETLQGRLTAAVPGAVADDHQRWLSNLRKLSRTIGIASALVVILVAGAAVVTVVFVTRTGLEIHRNIIELLHLMGAQDQYIARQFQAHALRLGLSGGLIGLIAGLLTVIGFGQLMSTTDAVLFPEVAFAPLEWAFLLLPPFITSIIAMVTARRTVLRTLARLP